MNIASDALLTFFSKIGLENKYKREMAVWRWPEIIGEPLASHTKALYVLNKKLYVKVVNSVYLFELSMQKEKILYKINHSFDTKVIDDLHFVQSSFKRQEIEEKQAPAIDLLAQVTKADQEAAAGLLEQVVQPELKKVLYPLLLKDSVFRRVRKESPS